MTIINYEYKYKEKMSGESIVNNDVDLSDVKFASGITNINFGFYPDTDVC